MSADAVAALAAAHHLSVAGKRRGLAGERSGLAFAFLDLVERHRPPAVLLENVPGLLSSHAGRDLGTLLGRLGELGYWWAYRVLDARHFGVPQRRRRVFIVALHARVDPDGQRAAEVLSVGSRCERHPATGGQAGPNAADGVGAGISRALSTSQERLDADTESFVIANTIRAGNHGYNGLDDIDRLTVGTPPDPGRVRAADGLAGRLDDRGELAPTLRVGPQRPQDGGPGDTVPVVAFNPYRTLERDGSVTSGYAERPGLPDGLDPHRYRCCGNGVVSSVSEWIGRQLLAAIEAAA